MHILCRFSGEYYEVPGFQDDKTDDRHPIFNYTSHRLLMKAKDWAAGKLSEADSKLLFIALLSKTDNIHFTSFADPSPSIVAQNMERLLRLVAWTSELSPGTIAFPAYRITESNSNLQNIGHFISEWYDCKRDWATNSDRRALGAKLELREQVLYKIIEDGAKSTGDYSGKLASWAMDAASVPKELRKLWTEFFNLKDPAIYSVNLEDFEKMKSFMDTSLMLGHSYAQGTGYRYSLAVLKHLRELHEQIKEGPLANLQGGMTYTIIDTDGTERQVDNTETMNARFISMKAPDHEPQQHEYPKLLDWLRAKAAWAVKIGLEDRTAEEAKKAEATKLAGMTVEEAAAEKMGL